MDDRTGSESSSILSEEVLGTIKAFQNMVDSARDSAYGYNRKLSIFVYGVMLVVMFSNLTLLFVYVNAFRGTGNFDGFIFAYVTFMLAFGNYYVVTRLHRVLAHLTHRFDKKYRVSVVALYEGNPYHESFWSDVYGSGD